MCRVGILLLALTLITSSIPIACGPKEVTFPDSNLEAAIRFEISKPEGAILISDLEGLTSLDASERNIQDLSALEYCVNLNELDLTGNQVSDVTPLASLTNLTLLDLSKNRISDVSPLTSLTKLTLLWLHENQIVDISPLGSLTNLTSLAIHTNHISDISPLASLTNLTQLYLWGNQISDISTLASLTSLTLLTLQNNQISDISPLTSLTNLTVVFIEGNPLSDTSLNIYVPQIVERGVDVSISQNDIEETYINAPKNVTAQLGEDFAVTIVVERIPRPSKGKLTVTIPHFTIDHTSVPEQETTLIWPAVGEGVIYPETYTTGLIIEPSELDIISLFTSPEIVLIIPPPQVGEVYPSGTMELPFEFKALNTGNMEITITLKLLTDDGEQVIEKVIEINVTE